MLEKVLLGSSIPSGFHPDDVSYQCELF